MIRKGTAIDVRFTFKTPIDAESRQQLEEWIKFSLHCGSCANDNPLLDYDMDALWSSIQIAGAD